MSEMMPVLYRAVLDVVAELEGLHFRSEAAQIRSDAIAAYSGAWDPRTAHRLQVLRARATRVVSGRRRPPRSAVLDRLERHVDLERTTV